MLRQFLKRYLCDHKNRTWIKDYKIVEIKPNENADVKEPVQKTLYLKRDQKCDDCGIDLKAEFDFR